MFPICIHMWTHVITQRKHVISCCNIWKHVSTCKSHGTHVKKMWYHMQHMRNMLAQVIMCNTLVSHKICMFHMNAHKFYMGINMGFTHYNMKMFQNPMLPMFFHMFYIIHMCKEHKFHIFHVIICDFAHVKPMWFFWKGRYLMQSCGACTLLQNTVCHYINTHTPAVTLWWVIWENSQLFLSSVFYCKEIGSILHGVVHISVLSTQVTEFSDRFSTSESGFHYLKGHLLPSAFVEWVKRNALSLK